MINIKHKGKSLLALFLALMTMFSLVTPAYAATSNSVDTSSITYFNYPGEKMNDAPSNLANSVVASKSTGGTAKKLYLAADQNPDKVRSLYLLAQTGDTKYDMKFQGPWTAVTVQDTAKWTAQAIKVPANKTVVYGSGEYYYIVRGKNYDLVIEIVEATNNRDKDVSIIVGTSNYKVNDQQTYGKLGMGYKTKTTSGSAFTSEAAAGNTFYSVMTRTNVISHNADANCSTYAQLEAKFLTAETVPYLFMQCTDVDQAQTYRSLSNSFNDNKTDCIFIYPTTDTFKGSNTDSSYQGGTPDKTAEKVWHAGSPGHFTGDGRWVPGTSGYWSYPVSGGYYTYTTFHSTAIYSKLNGLPTVSTIYQKGNDINISDDATTYTNREGQSGPFAYNSSFFYRSGISAGNNYSYLSGNESGRISGKPGEFTVFGFGNRPAFSNISLWALRYTVTYQTEDQTHGLVRKNGAGSDVATTTEKVWAYQNATGAVGKPASGYYFKYWTSDVNLTLAFDEESTKTIKAGEKIYDETLLRDIIVDKDIVLTAHFGTQKVRFVINPDADYGVPIDTSTLTQSSVYGVPSRPYDKKDGENYNLLGNSDYYYQHKDPYIYDTGDTYPLSKHLPSETTVKGTVSTPGKAVTGKWDGTDYGTWTFDGWYVYDGTNVTYNSTTGTYNIGPNAVKCGANYEFTSATAGGEVVFVGNWIFTETRYRVDYYVKGDAEAGFPTDNPEGLVIDDGATPIDTVSDNVAADSTEYPGDNPVDTTERMQGYSGYHYGQVVTIEDVLSSTETTADAVPNKVGSWAFHGWTPNVSGVANNTFQIYKDTKINGFWTFDYVADHLINTATVNGIYIEADPADPSGTVALTYVVLGESPENTSPMPPDVERSSGTREPLAAGLTSTDTHNADGIPGTWVFHGWYTEDKVNGDTIIPGSATSSAVVMVKNLTTVYGYWEFVPDTYNVYYHVLGNNEWYNLESRFRYPDYVTDGSQTGGASYSAFLTDSTDYVYGTTVTLIDTDTEGLHAVQHDNSDAAGTWVFSGWYTVDNVTKSGNQITGMVEDATKADRQFAIYEDTDLYGFWTFVPEYYSVTYYVKPGNAYKNPTTGISGVCPDETTDADHVYSGTKQFEYGELVPIAPAMSSSQDYIIFNNVDETQMAGTWLFNDWTSANSLTMSGSRAFIITEDTEFVGSWIPDIPLKLTYHVEPDINGYGVPSNQPAQYVDTGYDEYVYVKGDDYRSGNTVAIEPLLEGNTTAIRPSDHATVTGVWIFDGWYLEYNLEDRTDPYDQDTVFFEDFDIDLYGRWYFVESPVNLNYVVHEDTRYTSASHPQLNAPDGLSSVPQHTPYTVADALDGSLVTEAVRVSDGKTVKGHWRFSDWYVATPTVNSDGTLSGGTTITGDQTLDTDTTIHGYWVFEEEIPEDPYYVVYVVTGDSTYENPVYTDDNGWALPNPAMTTATPTDTNVYEMGDEVTVASLVNTTTNVLSTEDADLTGGWRITGWRIADTSTYLPNSATEDDSFEIVEGLSRKVNGKNVIYLFANWVFYPDTYNVKYEVRYDVALGQVGPITGDGIVPEAVFTEADEEIYIVGLNHEERLNSSDEFHLDGGSTYDVKAAIHSGSETGVLTTYSIEGDAYTLDTNGQRDRKMHGAWTLEESWHLGLTDEMYEAGDELDINATNDLKDGATGDVASGDSALGTITLISRWVFKQSDDDIFEVEYIIVGDDTFGVPSDTVATITDSNTYFTDETATIAAVPSTTLTYGYLLTDTSHTRQIPGTWSIVGEPWYRGDTENRQDGGSTVTVNATSDALDGSIDQTITMKMQWVFTPVTYDVVFNVSAEGGFQMPVETRTQSDIEDRYSGDVVTFSVNTTADTYAYLTTDTAKANKIPGVWTFSGWKLTNENTARTTVGVTENNDLLDGDDDNVINLYGVWTFTETKVSIIYNVVPDPTYGTPAVHSTQPSNKTNLRAGTYDLDDPMTASSVSAVWTPEGASSAITSEGTWTFTGWYEEDDAVVGGEAIKPAATVDTAESVTVYDENANVYGFWSFTPVTYTAEYEFVGAYPSDVTAPVDGNTYISGTTVTTKDEPETESTTKDGVPGEWTFGGWKLGSNDANATYVANATNAALDGTADTKFNYKGTWTFTPSPYESTYATTGDANYDNQKPAQETLPTGQSNVPYNTDITVGAQATTTSLSIGHLTNNVGETINNVPGTWEFQGWTYGGTAKATGSTIKATPANAALDNNPADLDPDLRFEFFGAWKFTPTKYSVVYQIVPDPVWGTPNNGIKPDGTSNIPYGDKYTVAAVYEGGDGTASGTVDGQTLTPSGTWTFSGWTVQGTSSTYSNQNSISITSNVTLVGTWTFVPDTYRIVYESEADQTYGKPTDETMPTADTTNYVDGYKVEVEDTPTTAQTYATITEGTETLQVQGTWMWNNTDNDGSWWDNGTTEYEPDDEIALNATNDAADGETDGIVTLKGEWEFIPVTHNVIYATAGAPELPLTEYDRNKPTESVTPSDLYAGGITDQSKYTVEAKMTAASTETGNVTRTTDDGTYTVHGTWSIPDWSSFQVIYGTDRQVRVTEDIEFSAMWHFDPDTYTIKYKTTAASFSVGGTNYTARPTNEPAGYADETISTTGHVIGDKVSLNSRLVGSGKAVINETTSFDGVWTFTGWKLKGTDTVIDPNTLIVTSDIADSNRVIHLEGVWEFTPLESGLIYNVYPDDIYGSPDKTYLGSDDITTAGKPASVTGKQAGDQVTIAGSLLPKKTATTTDTDATWINGETSVTSQGVWTFTGWYHENNVGENSSGKLVPVAGATTIASTVTMTDGVTNVYGYWSFTPYTYNATYASIVVDEDGIADYTYVKPMADPTDSDTYIDGTSITVKGLTTSIPTYAVRSDNNKVIQGIWTFTGWKLADGENSTNYGPDKTATITANAANAALDGTEDRRFDFTGTWTFTPTEMTLQYITEGATVTFEGVDFTDKPNDEFDGFMPHVNYDCTYDPVTMRTTYNGGTYHQEVLTLDYGTICNSSQLSSDDVFELTGRTEESGLKTFLVGEWTFHGWYTDTEYQNKVTTESFNLTEDTVLYGYWEFTVTEKPELTLEKKIVAEDINWMNGNPVFLFRVEGPKSYTVAMEFTEDYVSENTDSDGYVTISKTIEVVSGTYNICEETVARYELDSITGADSTKTAADSNGISRVYGVIYLEPAGSGTVTFTNEKFEWGYLSHDVLAINELKQTK